jgi:DNA repair exonuclease SbcCD ATPase subunit
MILTNRVPAQLQDMRAKSAATESKGLGALEEAKTAEEAALAKLEQSLLDRRLLVQRLAEVESEVQKLTENVGEYVLKVSFLSSLLSPLPCFDAS